MINIHLYHIKLSSRYIFTSTTNYIDKSETKASSPATSSKRPRRTSQSQNVVQSNVHGSERVPRKLVLHDVHTDDDFGVLGGLGIFRSSLNSYNNFFVIVEGSLNLIAQFWVKNEIIGGEAKV